MQDVRQRSARDWDEVAGRPIKHTDPTALRILADWVMKQMQEQRDPEPIVDRDFVVVG